MPKLSFNPNNNKETIRDCKNCIHSHSVKCGDIEYYECFPVKEYASTKKAIINCNRFYESEIKIRDIYIAVVVYTIYPTFKQSLTPIGCIFRELKDTDDYLWKSLKETDFYDKVKSILPDIGYTSNTLFEPIIFAERFIGEKKWNCISNIFTEEEKEDIISRLDDR